jgi:phenylalanyl-tRNA synthetase alpha chain
LGPDTTKIGQGKAFKNKWISKEGAGFVKAVCRIWLQVSVSTGLMRRPRPLRLIFAVQVESIDDVARSQLEVIRQTETHPEGEKLLAELRKRKLITAR